MPDTLTCPMCLSDVSTRSASCRSCHLPIRDVVRHQDSARSPRRRAITTRLWGLLIYAGIVAWCLVQLPTAAAFVVPAAVVGAVLHVVRGRVLVGGLVFAAIAVVAPALFWPSMVTDMLDGVGARF